MLSDETDNTTSEAAEGAKLGAVWVDAMVGSQL